MSMPFVSILLDNYNYEKYLPEALDSVLAQTYRNFELIIIDDGSKDRSREIISDFASEHSATFPIKTIFKENGGQTSAFNAGFEQCTGDIVCFLDSDDVWFPKKLERTVRAHLGCITGTLTSSSGISSIIDTSNHKNISSATCASYCSDISDDADTGKLDDIIVNHIVHHVETVDPSSNPVMLNFQAYAETSDPAIFDCQPHENVPKPYSRTLTDVNWHHALVQYGYMCHHSSCSSMSYSREILSQIFPLIRPEDMRFCSDTVVFTCCLSLAPMYKLDEVLSYYRIHGKNVYAGQYSGERDMELTHKIREYCNLQLSAKNFPVIDFHPSRYFEYICDEILPESINNALSSPHNDICAALYGTASAGIAFYDILSKKGYDICCFIDSDPEKQGTDCLGKPVIAPEQWREFTKVCCNFAKIHKSPNPMNTCSSFETGHDLSKTQQSRKPLILITSWASRDISDRLHSIGFTQGKDFIVLPI